MVNQSTFQVDLSGLIRVVGGYLYSSPDVAVRELIQNAVDACNARAAGKRGAAKGQVLVRLDRRAGRLIVEDDGVGMDATDLQEHLSRIGASTKRDGPDTEDFIGAFGIGFLAAFLLGEEVEVETRKAGAEPLRWVGRRDGTYSITPGSREAPGSTVSILVTAAQEKYLDASYLESLAKKFGRFLPIELSFAVNHEPPVRLSETAPWKSDEPAVWRSWLTPPRDVMAIFPFRHRRTRGLIWVDRAGSSFSSQGVDVFVKGMPITVNLANVLPRWAGFCGAVIDSADLQPTASREDLVRNEALEGVRQAMERAILDWLMELAQEDLQRLHQVLAEHPLTIKAACVEFKGLRAALKDQLPFDTTVGLLPWQAVKELVQGQPLYGTSEARVFENARALTASQGMLVVNHAYVHDTELLQALVKDDGLQLEPLTADVLNRLIRPAVEEARLFEHVLEVARSSLAAENIDVGLGRFDPPEHPAMLISESGSFAEAPSRGVPADFLDLFYRARQVKRARLVLNVQNPLIAALPRVAAPSALMRVIRILFVHSALTLRRTLTTAEVRMVSADLLGLLQTTVCLDERN
jgi:molecular chaperone HtpG